MNSDRSRDILRYVLTIGLGLIVLGAGYIVLAFWVRPAVMDAAIPKHTPNAKTAKVPTQQVPVTGQGQSSPSGQPTFPIRAAFYYPWFPESWKQQGFDPFTNYQPVLGFYDSSDMGVIKKHIAEMQYGNIEAGIASWWGQGSQTDKRFPLLLQAAHDTNFYWGIYYEMAAQQNPTADQIHSDLVYIQKTYASDPNFLKVDGRFVVFVYNPQGDSCTIPDMWKQANNGINAYLVLKVLPNYKTCTSQPDGWHQYAPAKSSDVRGNSSYTLSPGFWKKGEAQPRLSRDINQWATDVRDMVASKAQWQLITSFNEWGEGTAIEPATAWQTSSGYGAFLDVLHNNGLGQVAQLGSMSSPALIQAQPTTQPTAGANPEPQQSTPTSPSASGVLPTPMPSNLPANATGDPVLLAAGDISTCSNPGDFATAKIIEQNPNAVVASLGDTVYEQGSPSQFTQCFNPAWGVFKDRIHPAVGNHEYLTPNAEGYFGYFGASAGDPTKGYYSYDLGTWHIIVINSNCSKAGGCGPNSPQVDWLKADMAAHPAQCTLAYWHHPRWSSGEHGSQVFMSTIWDTLYQGGADVVLSGHDHDYERFAPLDQNGNLDPQHGIREFVVGTGGKNYYPFSGTFVSGSEVHKDFVFGVLKLTLHLDSYDWQFIPEPGKTFSDSGTGQCH